MSKLLVILFLFFSGLVHADLPMAGFKTGTTLDVTVPAAANAHANEWGTSAISVVGGKDDENAPRFAACYGWKSKPENSQTGKECTPNTIFNIASASKQMTAVMIDTLEHANPGLLDRYVFCVPGRLRANCILDNIVSFNGTWAANMEDVKVRQLRDHTAGISAGCIGTGCDRFVASKLGVITLPLSKLQLANYAVGAGPLQGLPGACAGCYSNMGYFYLSIVIEKLTGKGYEQAMHELVTRPRDIRDEDFKVCSNQKTNAKRDVAGNLIAVPTNGFDFRQPWKEPVWDTFSSPEVGLSDYDIVDSSVYPNTEDGYALQTRDGTFGLCATSYAYWKFAKSISREQLGLSTGGDSSWVGDGYLPGVGFASYAHYDGYTYVIATNVAKRREICTGNVCQTTADSVVDLNKVFDAVSAMSGNVMATRLSPLWNDEQKVTLKVYSLVQPDGIRRYFGTAYKSEQDIVESLGSFTKEEELPVFGKQFGNGGGTRFNLCRFHFQPNGKEIKYSSHFYGDDKDCNFVSRLYPDKTKTEPIYEDHAFALASKNAAGGCDAGLRPVYRLFSAKAINHRYTVQMSVVTAMQSQSWTYEGIVGCAPAN